MCNFYRVIFMILRSYLKIYIYRMSTTSKQTLRENRFIKKTENCNATHDLKCYCTPLNNVVGGWGGGYLLYCNHFSSSYLQQNMQHFTEKELADIHFV